MNERQRAKLLAVDDRKENLLVLQGLLEDLEVEVMTAQSGNDALALMLDHDFAVVLMDVQMPGMDGFETVELMKRSKRTRHVPVIYLTAISKSSDFVYRGYETGAVDYVFKPIEPVVLKGKVRVFVELDELKRELQWRNDELERMSFELEVAAMTDPLTGLRNRRYLHLSIGEETALAHRAFHNRTHETPPNPNNSDLGFLLLDLDHFKAVNDTHGHEVGDAVLVEVAEVMRDQVRESDIVVRWGGEEFLVMLRQTDRSETAVVAERLRARIAGHSIVTGEGEPVQVTCSIGCCVYPLGDPDHFDWEQVVSLADWALLAAKRQGRNQVLCVELEGREIDLETRDRIVVDPEGALSAGHIRLVDPAPSRD